MDGSQLFQTIWIAPEAEEMFARVQEEIAKAMTPPVYYPAWTAQEQVEWMHERDAATAHLRALAADLLSKCTQQVFRRPVPAA